MRGFISKMQQMTYFCFKMQQIARKTAPDWKTKKHLKNQQKHLHQFVWVIWWLQSQVHQVQPFQKMQANHYRKSLSFPQGQRGCPSCELQPTLVEVPIAAIAAMAAIAWPRPSRILELQVSSQVESDLPAVTAATGAPETTQATETRAPRALPVRAPVSLRNKNLILAGDSNDQRFFQALCRTALSDWALESWRAKYPVNQCGCVWK